MSDIAVRVDNVSKLYRLGDTGTNTLGDDITRWWASIRGKEDPFAKIAESNDRTQKAISNFVWSLKDVSFEVRKGEAFGVIGRNGAGKSTLLKILSRITAPTSGRLMIKGRIASLLEVGTGFNPNLTGKENIFMNGAVLGMKRAEVKDRLDEIIEFSGVARYIDTPVKRYSSGMYVRLAFSIAAHLQTDILILDEVLAVGDVEFQKKCLSKMEKVCKEEGKTIIYVSHAMPTVERLCNELAYLKQGSVFLEGATKEILPYYYEDLAKIEREIAKKDNLREREKKEKIEEQQCKDDGKVYIPKIELNTFTHSDTLGYLNEKNVIVEHVSFLDLTTGVETDTFSPESDVVMKLNYKSASYIKSLYISVQVFSNEGLFITVLNNVMSGYEMKDVSANGTLICVIKTISLLSGKYIFKPLLIIDEQNCYFSDSQYELTISKKKHFGKDIKLGIVPKQLWKINESLEATKNKAELSRTSLKNIERLGNQSVIFTSIKIISTQTGIQSQDIKSGEGMLIKLGYKTFDYPYDKLDNIEIKLKIYTEDHRFIALLTNKSAVETSVNLPLEGEIECLVQNIPLMSGEFIIKPELIIDGELSDKPSKEYIISIIENDYYKSGYNNALGRQGAYIDQKWHYFDEKFDFQQLQSIYLEKGTDGQEIEKKLELIPETSFEYDKTKEAQIRRIAIKGKDGNLCSKFGLFDDIYLEVEYDLRIVSEGISITMILIKNDTFIFRTDDVDTNEQLLSQREIGTYKSIIKFPDFLKAGIYDTEVVIGILNVRRLDFQRNVIRFEITEDGIDTTYRSYSAYRQGLIKTNILWDIKKLETNELVSL